MSRNPDPGDTPHSLLDRLRRQPTAADQERLVELYGPLLRFWLNRNFALRAEVDDLMQDILLSMAMHPPEPRPNEPGSFHGWLRAVMFQHISLYWRKRAKQPRELNGEENSELLAQLADPASPLACHMNEEHDRYVVGRLIQLIEREFTPKTWRAFRRHVLDELTPAAVATELGLSENAVLIARCRVMKRLREEARGLIDDGVGD